MGLEPEIWVAIIGGLAAMLPVFAKIIRTLKAYPTKEATNASSVVETTGTAMAYIHKELERQGKKIEAQDRLIDQLRRDVGKARGETAALRGQLEEEERRTDELDEKLRVVTASLSEYQRGVAILIAQLQRLGVDPDWLPPGE